MAEESVLGGLLGREAGAEEGDEEAVAPLDPSAAALAMGAAAADDADKALAGKAAAYFERQSKLVAIQTEHLHEQREVLLSHMKLKRLNERLRAGTQIFWIVVASIVAGYLGLMLYDAATSRSVVVELFDAPPVLAEQGLSGRVVAGALLDQLSRLQADAQSTAAKRALSDSWTGDIKIEVPETGLSLGEVDRLLKARLGHDLHIGGSLIQTASGGLELMVRGDGVSPRSFIGPAGGLDPLMRAAGEYLYGQTQPALFAVYLARAGRNAEAVAFSRGAVLTAAADQRPFILNAWATALLNQGGSWQESLALEHAALALKPDYWAAYDNAALDDRGLGDEEAAWREGEAMRKAAGGRTGRAPEEAYAAWDWLTGNLLAARSAAITNSEAHGGVGSTSAAADPVIAGLDVDLHDTTDAQLRLQSFDLTDPYTAAMAHYVRGRLAEGAGDTTTALREMRAYAAANADPAVSQGDRSFHCYVAPAEEAAGNTARADAEIVAGGHFVDCYRDRADVLDHRGDWAGAQRAYAAAVALAPDLPFAYESWGRALMRHGDLPAARAEFAAAHARGPHWADPLKDWGDLLAREGSWRPAVEKYDAALRYAPQWSALIAARDAAETRLRQ
jgi:tetratricopeptide (TPR) repeat protein